MTLNAATFVVPPDREIVRRADAIVIASALTSYSQQTADGAIETVTPMSIEEVVFGAKLPDIVNVVEPGGRTADRLTIIPGAPQFEPGERVLLMLRRTGSDRWAVADLALGKFTFAADVAGRKLLVRDEDEINGWDPGMTVHKEQRRAADRFLRFVREEARGVKSAEDYFVPTERLRPRSSALVVQPAATYTPTSYTMTVSGNQGGRWNVFPNGVNWFANASGEPGAPGNGTTAVQAGINAWVSDSGSNVNYVYAGTDSTHTSGLSGPDGANTVLFERDLSSYGVSPFTCSGSSYGGTLGIGGISAASGTHSFSSETFATITEGDVEMNRGIANCTALFNAGEFNSALAHELGHTLGFRHSDQNRASSGACSSDPSLECSSNAIMRSSIPNGLNAALQAYDINAVRAVYPGTTPPPCTPPTITAQPASVTITTGSSATLSVTATGTAPLSYQWYNGTSPNTGSPIAGATGTSITVTAAGNYWVRVTNGCGTANSTTATVTLVAPPPPARHTHGDYNGDGKTDPTVYRPSTGYWFVYNVMARSWGISGDIPVPADYDGDGKTDTAIWRPSNATWFIVNSSSGTSRTVTQGVSTDIPAPADLDGDGKAELIVYRPSNATWLIINGASGASSSQTFGQTNARPMPADYDGDGRAQIATYNPSSGIWTINGVVNGAAGSTFGWGIPGDIPVPADYDGDGDEDVAVYRQSTGFWYILNGGTDPYSWGIAGDIPVPGDYDGNGRYDRAVFRPSNGTWYVLNGGLNPLQYGSSGDQPQYR